jgi:hypothetical protein
MRKTLLAVGFAVLVSMLLAPHGNKQNGVEGGGLFFSDYGLFMRTKWGALERRSVNMPTLVG